MKTFLPIILLAAAAAANAQQAITKVEPLFATIVSADAQIEKLGGGLKFTEGPVWLARQRVLLFSDIPADSIMRWTPFRDSDRAMDSFRHPSGQANGLTLDQQNRLIACEHANRRVTRTEADGTITTLADKFEGKRLNSPNDVVAKGDGSIYFTDPPYGVAADKRELDFQGVFRYSPETKSLTVVARDFIKPNGLAFSPNQKILYIADSEAGHIRAFDVAPDGSLKKGRVFAKCEAPDGMKVDIQGNLYCTGAKGVMVFNPNGQHLGTISPPEPPANCAFGDADWQTLYMTCRTGLYKVRLNIPGLKVP